MTYDPEKSVTLTMVSTDWVRLRNAVASQLQEPRLTPATFKQRFAEFDGVTFDEMVAIEDDERAALRQILDRIDLSVVFDEAMQKRADGETHMSFYCPCCGKDR
jgi:hypothetical protein